MKKYFSEFLGTTCLTFFGCGTACIAKSYVGSLGIAIAFGLSFLMSYAICHKTSKCHFNPAISIAVFLRHKLSFKDLIVYIIAQILGAILGTFLIVCIITSANIGSVNEVGLAASGYASSSPIGLKIGGAIIGEIILSYFFTLTFLKATQNKKSDYLAPFIISFSLILIHLISSSLTSTSVNPALSLAPAIFLKDTVLKQCWVFIIFPIIGALLAALSDLLLNYKE